MHFIATGFGLHMHLSRSVFTFTPSRLTALRTVSSVAYLHTSTTLHCRAEAVTLSRDSLKMRTIAKLVLLMHSSEISYYL